jgi:nucleotide-binding universal stress UspA family protein
MFEKVLVAIDGSKAGNEAVDVTATLAKQHGSDVTVLHVMEHKLTWATDIDLESEKEARDLVDGAVDELSLAGVSAHGQIARAPSARTAQEIVDAAERVGASLIVMGTRGLTETKALLLGSITHDVLHRAGCPVLVTPGYRTQRVGVAPAEVGATV